MTRPHSTGISEGKRTRVHKPGLDYCAVVGVEPASGRFRYIVKLACGREVIKEGENATKRKSMLCGCRR